jgi:hypothetical protein
MRGDVAPMSPPGRPKGESLSAQREGSPVSSPGRPKGESLSAQREGSPVSEFRFEVLVIGGLRLCVPKADVVEAQDAGSASLPLVACDERLARLGTPPAGRTQRVTLAAPGGRFDLLCDQRLPLLLEQPPRPVPPAARSERSPIQSVFLYVGQFHCVSSAAALGGHFGVAA